MGMAYVGQQAATRMEEGTSRSPKMELKQVYVDVTTFFTSSYNGSLNVDRVKNVFSTNINLTFDSIFQEY